MTESKPEGERPWEEPGNFRMDCEPHRGEVVLWLGHLSLLCGGVSVFCGGLALIIPGLFALAPLALPLGFAACLMARRDLRLMRAGRMDPRGEEQTKLGRLAGVAGLILALIASLFWGWLYFWGQGSGGR